MEAYPSTVEGMRKRLYRSLRENDRRQYVAILWPFFRQASPNPAHGRLIMPRRLFPQPLKLPGLRWFSCRIYDTGNKRPD